jgi:hypothetical protein
MRCHWNLTVGARIAREVVEVTKVSSVDRFRIILKYNHSRL